MKTLLNIKILIILLSFGLSTNATTYCLPMETIFIGTEQDYSDDVLYPGGKWLFAFGTLQLIKVNNSNDTFHPSIVPTPTASLDSFQGPFAFNVILSDWTCKTLTIETTADSLAIDDYKFTLSKISNFPYRLNDSLILEYNNGIIEISGVFDTVVISNPPTEWYAITNACLVECSGDKICQSSFNYTNNYGNVNFTNTSTVNASESINLTWDFGNGETSEENNPTQQFSNGTFEVCLDIASDYCAFTPLKTYCEDITIDNSNESLLNSECRKGHFTMTPNNDGQSDFVYVHEGSKVYDRNGFLVKEFFQDDDWIGLDNNQNYLPTGSYQVICADGGRFNITIIR
jgi:hypothetical protein